MHSRTWREAYERHFFPELDYHQTSATKTFHFVNGFNISVIVWWRIPASSSFLLKVTSWNPIGLLFVLRIMISEKIFGPALKIFNHRHQDYWDGTCFSHLLISRKANANSNKKFCRNIRAGILYLNVLSHAAKTRTGAQIFIQVFTNIGEDQWEVVPDKTIRS